MFAVDVESGVTSPLIISEAGSYISKAEWLGDGDAVLYVMSGKVLARHLMTGEDVSLTHLDQPIYGSAIAVSPNSRWLAFTTIEGEMDSVSLKVMPISGGAPRKVLRLSHSEAIDAVAWTSDAQSLLFTRGPNPYRAPPSRKHDRELWRVPLRGGHAERLAMALPGLDYLRVDPDGHRVAFTAGEWRAELWVLENLLRTGPSDRSGG